MEVGALTAFLYMIKARESLWQTIDMVTGARVTVAYARVGGLVYDLPEGFTQKIEKDFNQLEEVLEQVDKLLTRNRIFMDRTEGVGVLSQEDTLSFGITGPLLRAVGVAYDVRKDMPYSGYERFQFDIPTQKEGDSYARYMVRMEEMRQSIRIVRQAIKEIPNGPIQIDDYNIALPPKEEVYTNIEALMAHFKLIMPGHGIRPPKGDVYLPVEAANGELGFYIVSDGGDRPYRIRCRPPCFFNTAALHEMIKGDMVADIVPTFGSINMIGGELDR